LKIRRVVAICWTLAIMAMCWLPGELVQRVEGGSFFLKIPHHDKFMHLGMFASFAVLWLRVEDWRWRYAWVVLAGFALAAVSEIGQALPLIGRQPEMLDFLVDLIGIAGGVAASGLFEPVFLLAESRILPGIKPSPSTPV
jgi:hypothetical protein